MNVCEREGGGGGREGGRERERAWGERERERERRERLVRKREADLLGHEVGDGMNNESDNRWRESERDGLHGAINVHGWPVQRTSHSQAEGARQQNLEKEKEDEKKTCETRITLAYSYIIQIMFSSRSLYH